MISLLEEDRGKNLVMVVPASVLLKQVHPATGVAWTPVAEGVT